ncbi:MAG: nuclear transport factor 2 family protein [Novosphingobium sp.]
MADREVLAATVERLMRTTREGNYDEWLTVWADDAEIEDPIGAPPWRGIEAIRTDFWEASHGAAPSARFLGDVIVCGNEAIALLEVEVDAPEGRMTLSPVVDHFLFDEAGRIKRLRAFYQL